MQFDWDELLGGANAHINFGAAELLSGVALLLPAAQTVVEIPATLDFTDDLVQAVKNLRQAGYRVALDGYERQNFYSGRGGKIFFRRIRWRRRA